MNSAWQQHLTQFGATFEDQRVLQFGDSNTEINAAASGTVLADLSHFGLIGFSGEDTQTFLQGQLTNDVRQVNATQSQYSSYCTPKGRMLASFLVWQNADSHFIQLPAELQASIQKRLAMFVMRAKVKVRDASEEFIRFGMAGDEAEALLRTHFQTLPGAAQEVVHLEHSSVIRLPGNRFEIIAHPQHAAPLWDALSKAATPVGAGVWEWLDIQAGVPVISLATQDQFVPQMVNYEVIGGVSFTKGCYPGQEIVARTQYLGRLKRRMYLATLQTDTPPAAGDVLYGTDMEGQATGMVVNAQPAPDGGFNLLAVIQISSAEGSEIHWKTLDGPPLQLKPLPYSLPPAQ